MDRPLAHSARAAIQVGVIIATLTIAGLAVGFKLAGGAS